MTLENEKNEKTELLNRMMSQDLPAFSTLQGMTHSTNSSGIFSQTIARDDETEAARLVALGGFGQTLFEEDAQSFHEDLAGLGLYVNTDDE